MSLINMTKIHKKRHSNRCLGYKDEFTGEYDCEYQSNIDCDDCMYCSINFHDKRRGKNPEAKCNHKK